MSLKRKLLVSTLLASVVAGVIVQTAVRAVDSPATASAPATAASRSPDVVIKDLQASSREIVASLGSMANIIDETKRTEAAPKAIPAMKKMLALLDEIKATTGDDVYDGTAWQIRSMLALLGDADTAKFLADSSASSNKATALNAKLSAALADYWKYAKNEAEQKKVVETVSKLALANPDSEPVTGTLMMMANLGPASKGIRTSLLSLMGAPEDGKPFAFGGPTIDGKAFNSADYKGKVVLVDFWATWCGPCRQELPELVKFYQKHKADGFEIVGVSLDRTADDLKNFLAENKDITWTQIYDEKQPLANKYRIQAIPTMYLIDQEGNLVTTEARGKYEELVTKLLEKKSSSTTKPAPEAKPAPDSK